jgi:hypothetical protein
MEEKIAVKEVPLSIVQTIDPRVDVGSARAYAVLQGGKEVTPQVFPATSYSDTNIVFDVNPPSSFILVDKKIWITCPFVVTFTGTDQGRPLLTLGAAGGLDGPRSYPLTQSILSSRATINNTTVSINTNNVMQGLLWYHNNYSVRREDYSGTPAMLDQSQNYGDLVGFVRNPLGQYGDNTAEEARGAGLAPSQAALAAGIGTFYVVSNTNTAATVIMLVQEPLFLSPFLFGPNEESAFYGINKMTINLQMGDLTRVWSHVNPPLGTALTSVTASISGAAQYGLKAPQVQFFYITPKPLPSLPAQIWTPYFEVVEYTTDAAVVAAGTAGNVTTNSIFFPTIPRRVYIFVRQQNMDRTYATTDTFALITSINVTFANRTGLLQSQTPQSLYNMAQKNGFEGSWVQWSSQVGSVLALDFGIDIGMNQNETAGVSGAGQYQFNATINFINLNQASSIHFTAYVVAIQEGTMLIEQNRASLSTGVVSPQDVLDSLSAPLVPYKQTEKIYGGGSFFSDLKRYASKAADAIVKYGPKAVDIIQKYGPAARSLLGVGARGAKRRGRGGVLVGAGLTSMQQCEEVALREDSFVPQGVYPTREELETEFASQKESKSKGKKSAKIDSSRFH